MTEIQTWWLVPRRCCKQNQMTFARWRHPLLCASAFSPIDITESGLCMLPCSAATTCINSTGDNNYGVVLPNTLFYVS